VNETIFDAEKIAASKSEIRSSLDIPKEANLIAKGISGPI